MTRQRHRGALAVLALAMVAACSGTAAKSVDRQPPAAETAPVVTTSTAPPGTAPAQPDPVETTTPPPPQLEPPVAPDAVDIAGAALDAPLGDLRAIEEGSNLLVMLERQLEEINPVIQSLVWDHLTAGEESILVAAIYPHSEFRGDPTLAPAMADLIGGGDAAPGRTAVDGIEFHEVELDGSWWYLWANHTHVLIAAGPQELARSRMVELAAHNADEYLWAPGDCIAIAEADGLGLPYAPYGEEVVVPCDTPHQWEVVAADATAFGDGDGPRPDPDQVAATSQQDCEEGFGEHVGGDPFDSSLEMIHYLPDELEWDRGDRYTACLATMTRDAEPSLVDRSFRDRGAALSVQRAEGDCHAWTVREAAVPCAEPHDFEFLGQVTPDDEAWPGIEGLGALADCEAMLEATASTLTVDGATLTTYAIFTGPLAWSTGDRRLACFVVADQAGAPVSITGSISGSWQPAGAPGDGITA